MTKSAFVMPPPAIDAGQPAYWRKIAVPRALKIPRIESIWLYDMRSLNVTPDVPLALPESKLMKAA